MQLRSNSVGATVEFHPEILFFLCFTMAFMYVMMRKYFKEEPSVVIYATPRMKPHMETPMEGDVIHINIQFSPHVTMRRTRAPSALDLSASAALANAEELKKEV